MQKIIPFKQEKDFKDSVFEITSISLEHTLHKEKENLITGEFLVSGDYKVVESSSVIDSFSFRFPFDIHLDEKYDLDKIQIDIDDFYYEIKNNKSLVVNIDVLLDKIEEKEMLDRISLEGNESDKNELVTAERDVFDISKITDEIQNPIIINDNKQELIIEEKNSNEKDLNKRDLTNDEEFSNIFDDVKNNSQNSIYKVYIVREEDTLMSIMENYKISQETLEKYNNIKEIKKGDKIIIPCE